MAPVPARVYSLVSIPKIHYDDFLLLIFLTQVFPVYPILPVPTGRTMIRPDPPLAGFKGADGENVWT